MGAGASMTVEELASHRCFGPEILAREDNPTQLAALLKENFHIEHEPTADEVKRFKCAHNKEVQAAKTVQTEYRRHRAVTFFAVART